MVALGKLGVQTIRDWEPELGPVVCWHPSPATLEKAREAPISTVPASYQQAGHIRGYRDHAARGLDWSRLMIATCDIAGRCDIRAMTYVINAHLRRHDTYRSWFEYQDTDHVVRRTIPDSADIEVVPTEHGEMTWAELRDHALTTPNPLQWGCFRFGFIQGADHFTLYICIDHVYVDAMSVGMVFMEIYMTYVALVEGEAPIGLPEAGSYDDYIVRQHQYTSALTLESPQVRKWVQFAENNGGTLPDSPVPLGDPSVACDSDLMGVQLMDQRQTERFESACTDAGARFSGGVFACAAFAEYELTGVETYYGLTPNDTRRAPTDFLTMGWFTGLVPITVPVGGTTFGDAARAAQASFDTGIELANVPFDRVLELAPWLSGPKGRYSVLSYHDAGLPPFSGLISSQLDGLNARFYHDGRVPSQLNTRVNRLDNETQLTVVFPKNPVARESVTKYAAALKSVYARVADGAGAVTPLRRDACA